MRYTIDVYAGPTRVATTTDVYLRDVLRDLKREGLEDFFDMYSVYITDNMNPKRDPLQITEADEYEGWLVAVEQATQWSDKAPEDKIQAAVNPNHYRGLLQGLPDLGWLDIESRKKKYQNPEVFLGAVDLQENKYMERLGEKDDPLQERKKSMFYKAYAILYMENDCKPIKADLVHEWMSHMPEMPGKCM